VLLAQCRPAMASDRVWRCKVSVIFSANSLKEFRCTRNPTLRGKRTLNKILVGLLSGLILGAIDGATAWFTPDVRSAMVSIMVGSSIKGMIVGALSGWFARS